MVYEWLKHISDRQADVEVKPRIPCYGVTTRCLVYPAGPGCVCPSVSPPCHLYGQGISKTAGSLATSRGKNCYRRGGQKGHRPGQPCEPGTTPDRSLAPGEGSSRLIWLRVPGGGAGWRHSLCRATSPWRHKPPVAQKITQSG
jgi:hypothetical protein